MNDTTQTLLRAVLKLGAGYAISKGIADESTTETITAGILGLAAVIWGVMHRRKFSAATPTPASVPIKTGPILLLLALGLCSGSLFVGCTSPPQRIAYNTVAAPAMTVEHAMQVWGDYVQNYQPGPEKERRVLDAFKKYKAAELEAIDAARLVAGSMGSTNALSTVNSTLQSPEMQQALSDLVDAIRECGAKL